MSSPPAREPARRPASRARRRAAVVPAISYPEHLPVVDRREDIAAAIRDFQVVVLAGETGSGKTTQIPKICLELGRGVTGMIGHTQPRRIAARAVAERIAEELSVELGGAVGYQVRFTDHSSRETLLKVMTDGILLAELGRDPQLRRYDTIILDEAHERSLNTDFLLEYLKRLLPRRPDLKLIVTSATIDPHRFAIHFASDGVPAPVLEVSGRTFPVEISPRCCCRWPHSASATSPRSLFSTPLTRDRSPTASGCPRSCRRSSPRGMPRSRLQAEPDRPADPPRLATGPGSKARDHPSTSQTCGFGLNPLDRIIS